VVGEGVRPSYDELAAELARARAEITALRAGVAALKRRLGTNYPATFCTGLPRAQPTSFYSPQSLVADARRHGVHVREPDINASLAGATLEPDAGEAESDRDAAGAAGIGDLGDAVARGQFRMSLWRQITEQARLRMA
jgi:hypothetical protein